jgi:hypothetical protein
MKPIFIIGYTECLGRLRIVNWSKKHPDPDDTYRYAAKAKSATIQDFLKSEVKFAFRVQDTVVPRPTTLEETDHNGLDVKLHRYQNITVQLEDLAVVVVKVHEDDTGIYYAVGETNERTHIKRVNKSKAWVIYELLTVHQCTDVNNPIEVKLNPILKDFFDTNETMLLDLLKQ